MSRAQWGHGFHRGMEKGEEWGEMMGKGEWQCKLVDITSRLFLVANALRYPYQLSMEERTSAWVAMYMAAAAREIEEVCKGLPCMLTQTQEFKKDVVSGPFEYGDLEGAPQKSEVVEFGPTVNTRQA